MAGNFLPDFHPVVARGTDTTLQPSTWPVPSAATGAVWQTDVSQTPSGTCVRGRPPLLRVRDRWLLTLPATPAGDTAHSQPM